MINIVVIAHGPVARVMLDSFSGVCHASIEGTHAFVIDWQTDIRQITEELRDLFAKNKADGTLVLSDLFGGTGSNITAILAQETENVYVLAGLNGSMLFSALHNRHKMPVEELAAKVEEDGHRGIVNVNKIFKE